MTWLLWSAMWGGQRAVTSHCCMLQFQTGSAALLNGPCGAVHQLKSLQGGLVCSAQLRQRCMVLAEIGCMQGHIRCRSPPSSVCTKGTHAIVLMCRSGSSPNT